MESIGLARSEIGQPDFKTGRHRCAACGHLPPAPPSTGTAAIRRLDMKAAIAALGLAVLTLPHAAAYGTEAVPVRTGDLDLASDKGQARLALRIHRAARAVCAVGAPRGLPARLRSERRCISKTQADALVAARKLTAAQSASALAAASAR
ncbi:UrcA family protein [Blastomonas sp.]|uniref:UrcA family protein n=1 Tax=Blastomonas sp. TaxID=1909299 RepID=UPI00406A850D